MRQAGCTSAFQRRVGAGRAGKDLVHRPLLLGSSLSLSPVESGTDGHRRALQRHEQLRQEQGSRPCVRPLCPAHLGTRGKTLHSGKAVLRSVFLEWSAVGDRTPPGAWGHRGIPEALASSMSLQLLKRGPFPSPLPAPVLAKSVPFALSSQSPYLIFHKSSTRTRTISFLPLTSWT